VFGILRPRLRLVTPAAQEGRRHSRRAALPSAIAENSARSNRNWETPALGPGASGLQVETWTDVPSYSQSAVCGFDSRHPTHREKCCRTYELSANLYLNRRLTTSVTGHSCHYACH
jgi:hypothetical protein